MCHVNYGRFKYDVSSKDGKEYVDREEYVLPSIKVPIV